MSADDWDDEPVREPIEAGDIVVFTRFGNGVEPDLIGQLGLLLENHETQRWIYAFAEEEAVHRRCVRVRAENGETVGARLDQLECWCNTGATLAEVVQYLRVPRREEELDRQLYDRTAAAKQVVDDLVKKLRRTAR